MDDYIDCPECGKSVPRDIEGEPVSFCPFCGSDLERAIVSDLGIDIPDMEG